CGGLAASATQHLRKNYHRCSPFPMAYSRFCAQLTASAVFPAHLRLAPATAIISFAPAPTQVRCGGLAASATQHLRKNYRRCSPFPLAYSRFCTQLTASAVFPAHLRPAPATAIFSFAPAPTQLLLRLRICGKIIADAAISHGLLSLLRPADGFRETTSAVFPAHLRPAPATAIISFAPAPMQLAPAFGQAQVRLHQKLRASVVAPKLQL
uniref:Uncharacterized protein LOC104223616 n=1 Tax=Nicotiana sylvestris TaxID=4096 RepID=A0A1U7WFF0_NICSY